MPALCVAKVIDRLKDALSCRQLCFGVGLCVLRKEGHDVIRVPDEFVADPGDEVIIDKATETRRILITGDKDFGEWVFLRGKPQPPLVRLAAMWPNNQMQVLRSVLRTHSDDLRNGALITATRDRMRVRHTPE